MRIDPSTSNSPPRAPTLDALATALRVVPGPGAVPSRAGNSVVRTGALPGSLAQLPNPLGNLPVENRLVQVRSVLTHKHLAGSFVAHMKDQLQRTGVIRVAVVDDFSPGQTHGLNVERRILASTPSYLRDRVRIVRYDMGGLSPERKVDMLRTAAQYARDKKFVALSVSGGIEAYGVQSIKNWIGAPLDRTTAARAFEVTAQRAKLGAGERAAWNELGKASSRIPVVTPVWNDGNTTLAALTLARSNGIVTTIDCSPDSKATEVPIADIRMPAQFLNTRTSQSAPTFIGQALGMLDAASARRIIVPTPRDSGYGNGGLPQ